MPGGNRLGPTGQGPKTGRGLGYCAGNASPGSVTMNSQGGGGRGRGRGGRGGGQGGGRGGRGFRNQFHATGLTGWQRSAIEAENVAETPQPQAPVEPQTPPQPQVPVEPQVTEEPDQVVALKQQADELSRSLQQIQQQLADLEAKQQVVEQ